MCVPCGPRKGCSGRTGNSISKQSVEQILLEGDFECLYKEESDAEWQPYEGCFHNLLQILHDGDTKVKLAGIRNSHYKEGYRTIIMEAPIFPATLLFRTTE